MSSPVSILHLVFFDRVTWDGLKMLKLAEETITPPKINFKRVLEEIESFSHADKTTQQEAAQIVSQLKEERICPNPH